MGVGKHRAAAISALATGVIVLVAWGHSMGQEPDEIRAARDQLRGEWVATRIRAGEDRLAEGPAVSSCRVEFDGKAVAFRGMIEGVDARGAFLIDPASRPRRIDLKMDRGWVVGIYELEGDTLTLCITPIALPERLGVPGRDRPARIRPAEGHHIYEFRRAGPGG